MFLEMHQSQIETARLLYSDFEPQSDKCKRRQWYCRSASSDADQDLSPDIRCTMSIYAFTMSHIP